jgi:hypothetical protein
MAGVGEGAVVRSESPGGSTFADTSDHFEVFCLRFTCFLGSVAAFSGMDSALKRERGGDDVVDSTGAAAPVSSSGASAGASSVYLYQLSLRASVTGLAATGLTGSCVVTLDLANVGCLDRLV